MRSEFVVALLVAALATAVGCDTTGRWRPKGVRVTQARIIDEDEQVSSEADEILKRIQAQQEALVASRAEVTPEEIEPQGEPAVEPGEEAPAPPVEPQVETVVKPDELTVDYLVRLFEGKLNLSDAETEAYRRLLLLENAAGDPAGGPVEELLAEARNALVHGDTEAAQGKVSEALIILRRSTDPTIDRVFFARAVSNYGKADVIENPRFSSGQLVLAVIDVSDFACDDAPDAEDGALYRTKMTYSLAVYDTQGQLFWQHNEGPFEYQASERISSMFLPWKFNLPRGLKAGQYVLKVEVVDHLAGRQTQDATEFTVR